MRGVCCCFCALLVCVRVALNRHGMSSAAALSLERLYGVLFAVDRCNPLGAAGDQLSIDGALLRSGLYLYFAVVMAVTNAGLLDPQRRFARGIRVSLTSLPI